MLVEHQKLIQIAHHSEHGWSVVREYIMDELLPNSPKSHYNYLDFNWAVYSSTRIPNTCTHWRVLICQYVHLVNRQSQIKSQL